jgi:uncharacterized protein with PQ loop repeat
LNCLGYMLYGCLIRDPFLMCSVTVGLPANYFAVSSALSILGKTGKGSNTETRGMFDTIILIGFSVWMWVAFAAGAVGPAVYPEAASATSVSIVGYTCIATCMLYYFAPLTVLMEIIKNKDAAGLYMPMVVMNLITSTVWAAYGFIFIGDAVVYAPNMFAVILSACQLYLKCAYPSSDASDRAKGDDGTVTDDDEETKADTVSHRPRSGSLTQEVLCGDGTVAVIEFTEEEAATRQRSSSSTLSTIAEKVLDVVDLVGPRRLPLEYLESGVMTSLSFDAADHRAAEDVERTSRRGRHVTLLDPHSGLLLSPSHRMKISTNSVATPPRTPSRSRRRTLSDPRSLPVIAEEGSVLGRQPTSDDEVEVDLRGSGSPDRRTSTSMRASLLAATGRHPPPPLPLPETLGDSERGRGTPRAGTPVATQYDYKHLEEG